jgi:hypothetical protein
VDLNGDISEEASKLSLRGARKGGLARARALDSETRSAIAAQAAAARWGDIQITSRTGLIRIGDMELFCAVLEDGTRLLSQSTMLEAIGRNPEKSRRSRGESEVRAPFLLANNLQPFISPELRQLETPIAYRINGESGRAWGYRAELLPMVCQVYLAARRAGVLLPKQHPAAAAAEIVLSGLSQLGIVALVDEATGYQEVRARYELQAILEKYVRAEFRPWLKTFPDEFFEQMYRIHGWEFRPGTTKRTPQAGKLVNKFIYDQLPPGVHDELRRLNPKVGKGYRRHKHHQYLTADTGNVHLDRQISTVTTLMRISKSRGEFEDLFERAFPPMQPKLPLVIPIPAAMSSSTIESGRPISESARSSTVDSDLPLF